MTAKILIVEDDEALVELLEYNLRHAGFDTVVATGGYEALRLADAEAPDLVVLDIMLPELDGISVCRELRMRGLRMPVLMLTALDSETDRVVGLEVGADDYLTKPFSPRELVARVRALLRRRKWDREAVQETSPTRRLSINDLILDLDAHQILRDGELLPLTPTEFELFKLLAGSPLKTFTRQEIVEKVWGSADFADTRTVDVHIRNLRRKIGDDPSRPKYIETVRGIGYRFMLEPQ